MHSHCLGELAYFCGAKSVEYQPTSTLMGGGRYGDNVGISIMSKLHTTCYSLALAGVGVSRQHQRANVFSPCGKMSLWRSLLPELASLQPGSMFKAEARFFSVNSRS